MAATVQYLTDEAGHKTGVLLSISDYEQLMEDIQDLAAIADRRDEPVLSHQDFISELRKDGLLPN